MAGRRPRWSSPEKAKAAKADVGSLEAHGVRRREGHDHGEESKEVAA